MELTNEQENLRRVIVTGAAGALGRKALELFVDAGCTVIGIDRNFRPGLHPHAEIHRLHLLGADLTQASDISIAFETINQAFGGVDGLVHCAGGFRFAPSDEVSDEDVDFLVDLNLKSTLTCTREALKLMKPNGFGRIVLVSSVTASRAGFGVSAYAASKAGLHAFIEGVATELKHHDVNISAVAPAIMDTPNNRKDMPDADFSKWVAPEDVARIMFLLTQPAMNPVRTCIIPVTAGV